MARKIIIDTDPGVDDSMAIFFALASPELDVIGLTTIFGNVRTPLATTNALRLLEIADRADIPVAQGALDPLTRSFEGPVPFVHGEDGQGDIFLPEPGRQPLAIPAAQFIIEQLRAQPGEITLVPIGPLTNIALALRLEPRICEWVDEVVLMGGNALVPGNASPAAEANIRNDPEAADLVFGADWQVTMVGLDVTLRVHMSPADIAEYSTHGNVMSEHITRILPHYRHYFEANYDAQGIFVHDSSAIAYLLQPELFQTRRWPMRVETEGIGRGKTLPATGGRILPAWADRPLVNVCVDVDGAAVVALEEERLRGA
ncbi:MAG: nucleoside hydrolase [Chloroflexi bacterium]|nr:nucleoside hydrolase [Chloroflexota bacterium]MDE2651205.1 nucleoside hydrolase [Chloroflexota bacterium]MXV92098.1 nucleoside hydrolase [Chloroflexota bacterium]MXX50050.1 nucleoside hydrolase [Chloroflexota bacterium]MXX84753.1 nucleoside hydrolase [Chloroflexota bacterium]